MNKKELKPIVKKVVVINSGWLYWSEIIGHNNIRLYTSEPLSKRQCFKTARRIATQLGVKLEVKK